MFASLVRRAHASGLKQRTTYVLLFALALSVLHHTDHALRVDHSGWPFRPVVTPFTYSLLAYPIILLALFGPRQLFWVRWLLLAGAAGFVVFAHTAIESPVAQFTMWAQNHSVHFDDVHNAFDVESPGLGVLAVVVSMALNITAVVAAIMMLLDGLRTRRFGGDGIAPPPYDQRDAL